MRQGDFIELFLEYTDNTEPRKSYRTWVAVSVIAAALQRKCWVSLGSETWYPNFYIILTGPPAARKGTAIRPGVDLLEKVGITLAPDEATRQALIKIMEGTMRTFKEGQTIEPFCSLTIVSPELTVFLKRGDEAMLSTLCDWFDCRNRYKYVTIHREDDFIVNVWANLLGATTPTLLQTNLPPEAFGAGLISRTIFVYEDNKDRIVIFPTLPSGLFVRLQRELEVLSAMEGQFLLTKDPTFLDEYTKFRFLNDEHPAITDPKLIKYNDRRPMHAVKLALIMSASRGEDKIIRTEDFLKAVALLSQTERKMTYAFRGIGMNPLAATQAQMMGLIASKKKVSRSELLNMFHADVNNTQFSEIIATLIMMKFCSFSDDRSWVIYNEDYKG